MFKAVGHPVSKLRRVAIGPIADPKLTPGDWRELTPKEVKMLATMQEMPKPKQRRTTTPKKKPAAASASKKKTAASTKRAPASKKRAPAAATRRTRATSSKREPRRGRG